MGAAAGTPLAPHRASKSQNMNNRVKIVFSTPLTPAPPPASLHLLVWASPIIFLQEEP